MIEFLSLQPEAFGIDISDLSVKICKLERRDHQLRLVSYGTTPLREGLIAQGEIKNEKEVAAALKEAARKTLGIPLRTKYVIVSLPEEKAFLQVIQLPPMKEEEVESAVRFQAENYIPYPADTVYMDYQIIPPPHGTLDHLDVLIASLPRVTVDAYMSVMKEAGFIPLAFETETIASSRALIKHGISPTPVFLVDLGLTRTGFGVFAGRGLRFATSIPVSSAQCTEMIAKTLGITRDAAEEIKIKRGLLDEHGMLAGDVFNGLHPVLDELIAQIKKYASYYESHAVHQHSLSGKNAPARVLLSGGGAGLKGLCEFMAAQLRLRVQQGDPWVNILPTPVRELPPISFDDSLAYTTALGLALRGITANP